MITQNHIQRQYPFLINQMIIKKLGENQTPFANNLAIPHIDYMGLNYLEKMAVSRYEFLMDNYARAFDGYPTTPFEIAHQNMDWVYFIQSIEKPYWRDLERLAIQLIMDDFNLFQDEILFDIEIVGFGEVSMPKNMNGKPENTDDQELKYEMNNECHKRHLINALSAGASKKGHYIFHLANERLNGLNRNLIPAYQKMMSANDIMYYIVGDEVANQNFDGETSNANAGYMEIKWGDDGKPIICVRSVNFPTLVHEIVKGIMEVLSFIALPEGKKNQQYVIDVCDNVLSEMWCLRLGPQFWEMFHNSLTPDEMANKKMKIAKIYGLPTNEFFTYFYKLFNLNC